MPIGCLGIGDRWLIHAKPPARWWRGGREHERQRRGVLLVIALPQLRRHRHSRKYMDEGDWRELPGPDEFQRGSRGGQRRRLD